MSKSKSKGLAGSPGAADTADAELTYEAALAQLEAIIDQIESGQAGLEQTIRQCERGLKLIAHCRGVLDTAEKRIAELTADDAGRLTVQEGREDQADQADQEQG